MKDAMYYEKTHEGVRCKLCPHLCMISESCAGKCRVRVNSGGQLFSKNYGVVSAINLDPVEKKPLYNFYPGKQILSIGSYGCNFHCGFCQNHSISMVDEYEADEVDPEIIVSKVAELTSCGNIGLAFTYNEPFVGYEYMLETAQLVHKAGLKNIIVTNGFVNEKPLLEILPFIHAMNIDLKGFSRGFYKKLGGNLQNVLNTIELAAENCHLELTTLIIPGENDDEEEIRSLSKWVRGLSDEIPLHITRFFPRYKFMDKEPTCREKIKRLAKIAAESLKYVYCGNM